VRENHCHGLETSEDCTEVRRAWALLVAIAVAVAASDVAELRGHERPLIDRRSCQEEPSSYTLALDGSLRGDALYRFVYSTLLGFGRSRAGFPHVEPAPACTVGWKDPVAAIRIGPHVFLVTFAGARVDSVTTP
jgi:hypothetical protein